MKFNSWLEEEDYILAIDNLNAISDSASFPLKQIAHSITAKVYWGYYQANRWKFMNRTQTVNFENKDIRTWDLTKLANHVIINYKASLSNSDSLQHVDIAQFNDMLDPRPDARLQRPTLYDFLAHTALDFLESTEYGLPRPADKFTITGSKYFGPAQTFISIPIRSSDSMANELYALNILQQLTIFHASEHLLKQN
jgi:hypothetical protein